MQKIGVRELILVIMVGSLTACGVCVLSWIIIELVMWRSTLAENKVYVMPVLHAWLVSLGFLFVGTSLFAVHESKPVSGPHGMLWRAMVALDKLIKGADADVEECEDRKV